MSQQWQRCRYNEHNRRTAVDDLFIHFVFAISRSAVIVICLCERTHRDTNTMDAMYRYWHGAKVPVVCMGWNGTENYADYVG